MMAGDTRAFVNASTDGARLVITSAKSRDGAQLSGEWVSACKESLVEVEQ